MKRKEKCYTCNDPIIIQPYRLKKTKRFFCKKDCQIEWQKSSEYKNIHARKECYTQVICSYCTKVINKKKSLLREHYNFCNYECRNSFMSKSNDKYNPNPSKPYVSTKCLDCGYSISIPMSVFKKNINGHFCSPDCYWTWKSKNLSGEASPYYKRTIMQCSECKKELAVTDFEQERNYHHFCSRNCYSVFRSKFYVGDKSPMFGKKRPELIEPSRVRILQMLQNGVIKKKSNIQKTVEGFLKDLHIESEAEKTMGYYSIDHYLIPLHLAIETMGDYWHATPLKYQLTNVNATQLKGIHRDKRKQTYISRHFGINILYLWESDILNRDTVCKMLLSLYVRNNGILKNYHSFNYSIVNNSLEINKDIINPLWINNISQ